MPKTKPYDADNYGWDVFVKACIEKDLANNLNECHPDGWMASWLIWKEGYITGFASGMLFKSDDKVPEDEVEEENPHESYLSEKDQKEQEHPFKRFLHTYFKR